MMTSKGLSNFPQNLAGLVKLGILLFKPAAAAFRAAASPPVIRKFTLVGTSILALGVTQGVGAASVTLQWDPVTNDPQVAGYAVHFGKVSGQYDSMVLASANGAATNTQIVQNLQAGTTYYFTVASVDQDQSLSSPFSNEVSETIPLPDTMPPRVTSLSISNAGPYTFPQTVTIKATASDNVGVSKVEFYDGGNLKGTATAPSFSCDWAITKASNGTHTWNAKAYDAAGNVGTSGTLTVKVKIQNHRRF